MHAPLVAAENLTAGYRIGPDRVTVLEGASVSIQSGERVAVTGPSGSGKTTLLSLIGALERPEAGRVVIDDVLVSALSRREATRFRGQHMGFVFQAHHLIAGLTAVETVEAGLLPTPLRRKERRRAARAALEQVGLGDRTDRFPHELSGGEQQRVAVARAAAKSPRLLLADEPTGNLDEAAGQRVIDALFGEPGRTVLIVTHDPNVAARADRTVELRDHRVHEVAR